MAVQIFSALILLSALPEFDWGVPPASASVVATRFVCGLVLHVYLQSELVQGFSNMKYALNHPWKFDAPGLAFFAGFAQAAVIVVIEGVNYIMLLTKTSHLDIVLNFLVLVLIS